MRNKRLTVEYKVFGFRLHVIFAASVERTSAKLRFPSGPHADAIFITDPSEPMVAHLVLSRKPLPGTIAHEAGHAIWYMLKTVDAFDEETFMYHLDDLVNQIHHKLA